MAIYGKYITENCNNVLENFNTYINESENFDIITESLDLNKAKDFLIQGVKKIKEFIVKIGKSIVNFFKNFMSWIKTVGVKIKEKAKLLLDGLIKKEDLPKDFQDKIDKCVIKCYAYGDFYKENKVDLKYSSFDLKSFDDFDDYIDYDEYITKDEKNDNSIVEEQLESFKSVFDNCSGKIKTRIKDLNTKSDLYNFLDKEIFEFVPKVEVCVYNGTNKDFVNKIAIVDPEEALNEMKSSYKTFEKVHNESMKKY